MIVASMMESRQKALADSALFSGLPKPLLRNLADIAQEKQYRRGETIFLEGRISGGFYMVMQGQVKILKMSLDGKEQILYILGAGEPFGITPVFHGKGFPASAVSMTASTALHFPKGAFLALVAAHPELTLAVLSALCLRMRRLSTQIESLSLKDAPMRLAAHLLYLAEQQGNTMHVTLNIPKKQLANLLGTSPETLSRIFAEMSADGLLRVKGKRIELLRIEELKNQTG